MEGKESENFISVASGRECDVGWVDEFRLTPSKVKHPPPPKKTSPLKNTLKTSKTPPSLSPSCGKLLNVETDKTERFEHPLSTCQMFTVL
jgi:hypothetical protein